MQILVMMAKACKSTYMISKHKVTESHKFTVFVAADIIDKIVEASINSQINRPC